MASGTFWTEQRPNTRVGVVRVALCDLLLVSVGWAAGALTIQAVGATAPADPFGLFVLTVFVAIAVALGLLGLIRREAPWRLRSDEETDLPSIVWTILGISIAQACVTALLPYTQGWSPMQAWAGAYAFLIVVVLVDLIPKFVRPTGWRGIMAAERRAVPLVILLGLVAAFTFAWVAGEAVIAATRIPCDPRTDSCVHGSDPGQAVPVPLWFGGWSVVAVLTFAARLRFIALAAVGMAAFGYGFWVQEVWREINGGATTLTDVRALIALHVVGTLALVAAAATIEIYEPRSRHPEELRVLRWFGAGSTNAASSETPAR